MPAYSPRNGKRAKGPSAQRKNRSWPLRSSMRIPLQPTRWGRSTPDYITTLWHRSLNPVLRCTWLAPADVRQSGRHNTSSRPPFCTAACTNFPYTRGPRSDAASNRADQTDTQSRMMGWTRARAYQVFAFQRAARAAMRAHAA